MRYFKLALAAGASIVVAARLSPAHALPPVYPLDANGPMRQGHMCIAPTQSHFELESYDTGPGYGRFYECGRHKRAHREARVAAHGYATHGYATRGYATHGYATHGYPGIELRAPSYHHLDTIGPIRQGRWCIAPTQTRFQLAS